MQDTALIADVHADTLSPECRTDNYLDALCAKLEWLMSSFKHIIIAGDLFDQWKVEPYVTNRLLSIWRDDVKVYAIPGQHDLPQHDLKQIERSSFETLVRSGMIIRLSPQEPVEIGRWLVYGAGWGEPWPLYNEQMSRTPQLLVAHKTTWMDPFAPGQIAGDAARLLMATPKWDGILVGDNHATFAVQARNRVLVSPGSVMRKRVDQIKHRPCCFTLGASTINVDPVFIPVRDDCMTTVVYDKQKAREMRTDTFVRKLSEAGDEATQEVGLSFTDNLRTYLATHEVDEATKSIIAECTEGQS